MNGEKAEVFYEISIAPVTVASTDIDLDCRLIQELSASEWRAKTHYPPPLRSLYLFLWYCTAREAKFPKSVDMAYCSNSPASYHAKTVMAYHSLTPLGYSASAPSLYIAHLPRVLDNQPCTTTCLDYLFLWWAPPPVTKTDARQLCGTANQAC